MAQPTLVYARNDHPGRGLAAVSAVPPLRLLLALPHIWVPGILLAVSHFASYVGYWFVAFTGTYPPAIHRFVQMSLRWTARSLAWAYGVSELYPPFEADPLYPVDIPIAYPMEPDRRWAVAGLFMIPKTLVILPHLLVGMVLLVVAGFAGWVGFVITAFTGRFPRGIQDFAAGAVQWVIRSLVWLGGLNDQYPPFSLAAQPQPRASSRAPDSTRSASAEMAGPGGRS